MEEKKFGTVIFDGKIYNLDKMTTEELNNLRQKMEEKEKKITEQIDSKIDTEDDESAEY